jgi:hypothetical protein
MRNKPGIFRVVNIINLDSIEFLARNEARKYDKKGGIILSLTFREAIDNLLINNVSSSTSHKKTPSLRNSENLNE